MRGKFISIEGTDGSGKSTQMSLLDKYLRENGHNVLLSREPGGTFVGEKIRSLVLDIENESMCFMTEALLYAAARAQHVEEIIRPALEAGTFVICDRFVDSSIVYQGAARGLGMDKVKEINDYAINGVMPDITLYFDIPPEKGILRKKNERVLDRLEIEKMSFYQEVYDAYAILCERFPKRIRVINADDTIENVFAVVKKMVLEIL